MIGVDGAKHLWVGENYVRIVLNEIVRTVNPAALQRRDAADHLGRRVAAPPPHGCRQLEPREALRPPAKWPGASTSPQVPSW